MAGKNRELKVVIIGVGGGGNKMVRQMVIPGVSFVHVDTDLAALFQLGGNSELVQIGNELTNGFGCGGDPEKGKLAAEANADEIRRIVSGANLVFVTAALGGGTGTGAAPVIVALAKEAGATVVALVTEPFNIEAEERKKNAQAARELLKSSVGALITVTLSMILGKENAARPGREYDDAVQAAMYTLGSAVRGLAKAVFAQPQILETVSG